MREKRPISKKQLDYINILLHGEDSNEWDIRTMSNYLASIAKENISEITIKQASELIDLLRKKIVDYILPCGERIRISRDEVGRFNFFGPLEACSHRCPKGIDIHDCKEFMDYKEEENVDLDDVEEITTKVERVPKKLVPCIKCDGKTSFQYLKIVRRQSVTNARVR